MARQKAKRRTHFLFVFSERQTAERALRVLLANGLPERRVTLFSQAPPDHRVSDAQLDHAIDSGGAAGAGLGALAGAAFCAIPGIGPVLGVGPLAAAIIGAITGGTVGGVAGSFLGVGVAEAAGAFARHHLKQGKAILLIENGGDEALISRIARDEGATEEAIF